MSLGECPKCDGHSRCYDCDVKSHPASDAEIEEEDLKIARSAGRDSSVASSRGQPSFEPESSSGGGNVRISSGRVARTFPSEHLSPSEIMPPPGHMLPSGHTPLPRTNSSRLVFYLVYVLQILIGIRHSFSTANRAPLIIKVAVISENDSAYVLREHDDADLITAWNQNLPTMSHACRKMSQNLVSIHLFRIGRSEESSIPTIIVNTNVPLLIPEKEAILRAISLQPGLSSFPDTYTNSASIQLVFRQCRLRRSMDTSSTDEPPICEPRNRQFNSLPGTGNSIGMSGSIQDTATLGCYLIIGNVPYILTVDHLMPWRSPTLGITHISAQDEHALIIKALNVEVSRLMAAAAHSCPECDPEVTEGEPDHLSLRAFYLFEIIQTSNLPSCPFLQHLKEWCLSPETPRYYSHLVARSNVSSGRRYQVFQNVNREMDWAVFRVEDIAPLYLLPKLLSQHHQVHSDFDDELTVAPGIRPGALVVSVGRTSGYQTGKISTTLSSIFHEEYVTQEWCVIKRAETSVEEWVEGGIGVEGDSGALIVDEMTKEVYGMLWGRTGDGAATATIFTPLREIFEDIELRYSSILPYVGILKGQQLPRLVAETGSPLPIRGSIPTVPISIQPFEKEEEHTVEDDALLSNLSIQGQLVAPIPTAPISIQLDGKEGYHDQPFEQTFSSLSLTRQSSTDQVRHLPFKRYRRHSRSTSDQDIGLGPSTPQQEREDKVESKSWPGTHTYIRYALGDQG
jgi:hypothetical protein